MGWQPAARETPSLTERKTSDGILMVSSGRRAVARSAALLVSAAATVVAQRVTIAADPAPVSFDREVRPILSDKCFKCHGPDENNRKSRLRLDHRDEAKKVLLPSDGKTARLLRRIRHADPEKRMPPVDSKLSLSKAEIHLLELWIGQGAKYEGHWSFIPLGRPDVPETRTRDWSHNELDAFVLARLEREGLNPSPEATKESLIRRVTFDLLGVPPSLDEIDAFLADGTADAYEKLIDRLLERPEYGERMAADWLDIARYSDSYGYQVDRDRYVWPWRDWVIRSFNRNQPYDEFVTWQLAGDLLANASDDQLLATTFQRLHPQKVEGGSVPEEFRVEYVAARVHTFATAFLGLTLECARCHPHKYDPISQTEYYRLFAFFNSIDESGLYSYFTSSVPTPTLLVTDAKKKKEIADIESSIADAEEALAKVSTTRGDAFEAWLNARPADPKIPGRVKHLDFEAHKGGANRSVEGKVGKAIQLSGDDGHGVGVGNFPRFHPFSVALWMRTPEVKERAVVFHRSRAWTDSGSRGYQLLVEEGKLSASLIHFWPGNAVRVKTREPIPTKTWVHVAITYDGSSRARGLRIFIDGKDSNAEIIRDNLYKNITGSGGDNITIGERFRDKGFTGGKVDEFQVFDRQLSAIEVAQIADGKSLESAMKVPLDALTDEDRSALLAYYLATTDEEHKKAREKAKAERQRRSKTVDGIREIMVMRELVPPRPTFVLHRGAYDSPAAPVRPDTPAVFPPFPDKAPRNRLGLARWLTHPEHPLTARVAVNRLWQMCFGDGLVRTPEDFGSQGEPATHPRMLDWLARDFVDGGWDVKRLLKRIVTSSTYRQRSTVTRALHARDPENRLLARAASYRLPAEMIRDNALAIGDLLVRKIGGAPAKPYEVAVSFKPMGHDKGEGLYRRSVYTYWKRTGPAPAMMALDAAKRDVCRVKRERTASPLQALVILNGPQFVEAARVLGEAMVKKHGDDVDAILEEIFRRLTSRRPSPAQAKILRRLHDEQLAHFEADPKRAEAFLETGNAPRDAKTETTRAAAAGAVVNVLLSYDECVVKR